MFAGADFCCDFTTKFFEDGGLGARRVILGREHDGVVQRGAERVVKKLRRDAGRRCEQATFQCVELGPGIELERVGDGEAALGRIIGRRRDAVAGNQVLRCHRFQSDYHGANVNVL